MNFMARLSTRLTEKWIRLPTFSTLAPTFERKFRKIPSIENFRSAWPEPMPSNEIIASIPARTVPDEFLRFKLTATFDKGMAIFYPHLQFHPADFKVTMLVFTKDLNLSYLEEKVFIELVGPRYNPGRREVRLIEKKFPNRMENKKYLILLLEKLLLETRRIARVYGSEDGSHFIPPPLGNASTGE